MDGTGWCSLIIIDISHNGKIKVWKSENSWVD